MFKRIKIGTKLALSFGMVWLIVMGIVVSAVLSLNSVAAQVDQFYETAHSAAVLAWQARRDIRLLEGSIYNALASTDLQETQAAIQQANQSGDSYGAALTKLKEYLPEKTGELDAALEIAKQAKPTRTLILELAGENKNEQAMEEMRSNYVPALDRIISIISETGVYAEEEAKNFVLAADKTSRQTALVMGGVGVLAALFILVLTKLITDGIATPAKKISERIVLLANGDLKTPMPVIDSRDEVGVLAQSTATLVGGIQFMIGDMVRILTEMSKGNLAVIPADTEYKGDFLPLQTAIREILGALNDTLSQIHMASQQVSGGADQVSSGAQALSQGATEQASSIEQLSAAILEISQKVNQNAVNSQKASETSTEAMVAVSSSNTEMQTLARAINEINEKSKEISKIIKTIEDIAFQTNILALNAAVEAARAGVAGKGFAVVADEVRNLASKSSEAAKTTTALIEESIKAVENGTRLANETASHLTSIVQGAQTTTQLITQVTDASNAQASALKQIEVGVEQISAVVQTNSATSEESAAASEELSSQASLMKSLVARFRLKDLPTGRHGYAAANALPPAAPHAPQLALHEASSADYY